MSAAPGPWLRLTALAAVAATALVVATGEWGGLSHQAAALVALVLLAAVAVGARAAYPRRHGLVRASAVALGVFGVQVAHGGVVAATDAAGTLHTAAGAASLVPAALAAVLALRSGSPVALGSWRDYLILTKPRIMILLLLTAACGMVVGAGGLPDAGLFAAMMGGLALACGGASALNHVLDRDIDRLMGKRTERRPVAAGRVAPERALEFGVALSALAFAVLTIFTNLLAAGLAVFGGLFYVLVYTRWLKRSTAQNIVIGGAAGAVPPLVGWAAATGNLTLPALALFAIVFVWTPPHFWALALLIKRNYEAARVPMLPVVAGERATVRAILWYTAVLVAVTLLPVLLHTVGVLYLAAALALGAVFVALAVGLARETTPRRAGVLFHYSLAYLALLFVFMAVDPIVL